MFCLFIDIVVLIALHAVSISRPYKEKEVIAENSSRFCQIRHKHTGNMIISVYNNHQCEIPSP